MNILKVLYKRLTTSYMDKFIGNFMGFCKAYEIYSYLRSKKVKWHIAILVYHEIGEGFAPDSYPPTQKEFEEQIRYLCGHYEILSMDSLVKLIREGETGPRKAVVLTFDDGYKNNYLYAYPILKKYNVPAIIYLSTGNIGNKKPFWQWQLNYAIMNTPLKQVSFEGLGTYTLSSPKERAKCFIALRGRLNTKAEEEKNEILERIYKILEVDIPSNFGERMLSWEEVKEMSANGIDFGAHTVNHIVLTNVSLSKAWEEISYSKREIEDKLRREIRHFAYPYGNYNGDIITLVRKAGFLSAVTSASHKLLPPRPNLYTLDRINVGKDFHLVNRYISGLYPDIKSLLKRLGLVRLV